MNDRHSSANPVLIMIIVIVGFIGVGVWWLESRFDSTVAIVVVGGLFGVVCLVIGYLLNLASTKSTLAAAADFNHDLAGVERYRQAAFKELMRADGHIRVIDAKRIDQIAQQRAGLIVDLERQKQQQPALTWNVDDEGDGDIQEWE